MKPTPPFLAAAALWAAVTLTAAPGEPLRVKASPVASPCVAPAAALYQQSFGRAVRVETGSVERAASAAGSDVLVGGVDELTRALESGAVDIGTDAEIARIPWVLVGASADLRSASRSGAPVRVPGGVVSREARRSLAQQGLSPQRLASLPPGATAVRLAAGESAIVPLSLAGPATGSAVAVPPVTVRAAAVTGSVRAAEARAFVQFLAAGAGNEAFRACGRGTPE